MEAMVIILIAGLMGGVVIMGVMGMVQEIIRRKKVVRQLKERRDKEKQI